MAEESTGLEIYSHEILTSIKEETAKTNEYIIQLAEQPLSREENQNDLYNNIVFEINSLKRASANLKKAHQELSVQTDEFETRLKELMASKKKRKFIKRTPSNFLIDIEEQKTKHFAQGLNFYKIFLVFFIGSFAGVIIELLWCLVTHGYIESRSGLVYGPFNLLYGAGATALTAVLYKYRNRNSMISFLGGFFVGSAVEYVCSWGQELVFGSRSWDYSHMPFNVNGRICLMYSVFWGILGVLWIKKIYPLMANLILKIPNRIGKTLTFLLLAFIIFNASVTMAAMFRWTERMDGEKPSNVIEEFIDKRFPDERMSRIFINMKFDNEAKK